MRYVWRIIRAMADSFFVALGMIGGVMIVAVAFFVVR
jgi:hypothetical protein